MPSSSNLSYTTTTVVLAPLYGAPTHYCVPARPAPPPGGRLPRSGGGAYCSTSHALLVQEKIKTEWWCVVVVQYVLQYTHCLRPSCSLLKYSSKKQEDWLILILLLLTIVVPLATVLVAVAVSTSNVVLYDITVLVLFEEEASKYFMQHPHDC